MTHYLMTIRRALMSTLGDFEFESVQFASFVQATFSALFELLKEAKECDTKMSVLNVMSFVVDKTGDTNSMKDAESLCKVHIFNFFLFD